MTEKIIINGEGAILGRLATYAAKQALGGNEIIILNSQKIIISGNAKDIIAKYKRLRGLGGTTQKGPYFPSEPSRIVKRAIRGMVPDHRRGIGKQAFRLVKCYENIPREFEHEKLIKIKTQKPHKFIEIKELSEKL